MSEDRREIVGKHDERSREIKGVRQELKPYTNERFNYPEGSDKGVLNLKYQTGSPGFEPGLSDPESERMVRYLTSPLFKRTDSSYR